MRLRYFAAASVLAAGLATAAHARDLPDSGPAVDGSPAWFTDRAPDIHVHNYASMCMADIAKFCRGKTEEALRICRSSNKTKVSQTCQTVPFNRVNPILAQGAAFRGPAPVGSL
jgi:hypothetical protein